MFRILNFNYLGNQSMAPSVFDPFMGSIMNQTGGHPKMGVDDFDDDVKSLTLKREDLFMNIRELFHEMSSIFPEFGQMAQSVDDYESGAGAGNLVAALVGGMAAGMGMASGSTGGEFNRIYANLPNGYYTPKK